MTPHEVLSLCADLGLDVRAEDGNLYVSPAEKLPATLRTQLGEQKEALLEILSPPLLDPPRSALRRLEKQLGMQGLVPEPAWIVIRHRGHEHTETEVETVKRRICARALERYARTRDEADLGVGLLRVGLPSDGRIGCSVCQELRALPVQEQATLE